MANVLCTTVTNGLKCARKRANYTRTGHLKLFRVRGQLEFIAMIIFGLFPKTENGNQFVLIMPDRYSKLTRSKPTSKTSAMHIASIFFDIWIVPFEIPAHLLTDNGTQILSRIE